MTFGGIDIFTLVYLAGMTLFAASFAARPLLDALSRSRDVRAARTRVRLAVRAVADELYRLWRELCRRPDYARIHALEIELGIVAPPAPPRLSADAQALVNALRMMATAGRITLSASEPLSDALTGIGERLTEQTKRLDANVARLERARATLDEKELKLASLLATHTNMTLDEALKRVHEWHAQYGELSRVAELVRGYIDWHEAALQLPGPPSAVARRTKSQPLPPAGFFANEPHETRRTKPSVTDTSGKLRARTSPTTAKTTKKTKKPKGADAVYRVNERPRRPPLTDEDFWSTRR